MGPEALLIPVLLAALWVLRGGLGLERVTDGRPPVSVVGPPAIDVWSGAFEGTGGPLVTARLTPLHADAEVQSFDARVLRARLGLPTGEPWRLEIERREGSDLRLVEPRVVDAEGRTLSPPATGAGEGPLGALFGQPTTGRAATRWDLVLWGPRPSGELVLEGVRVDEDVPRTMPLVRERLDGDRLPRGLGALPELPSDLETGRADGRPAASDRIAELEQRVAELTAELARSVDARIERERSYVAFQQRLAGLPDPLTVRDHVRAMLGLPPDPEEAAEEAEQGEATEAAEAEARAAQEQFESAIDEKREAGRARARTLNTLLRAEGVWAIELLEAGEMIEVEDPDDPAAVEGTGPVVFRQIDGDGRLAGGITAAALRLEGSRAGRSLTIVLTEGSFREGGQVRPFVRGQHRIELEHVDPEPFMDALPELFRTGDLERRIDDGQWSLPLVRGELNRLLRADANGQRYHLAWLGGVLGEELRDVRFDVLDENGRVERLIFADALRIAFEGSTVELQLREGSTVRGEEKAPFLDGRMRIVLPRVDVAEWRAATLPGLDEQGEQ